MTMTFRTVLIRSITLASLIYATTGPVRAGLMPSVAPNMVQQQGSILHLVKRRIVHHRVYRRARGVGPAAVLGLFGAIIGAGIASQRYDNYSNYAYGQPYYGYGQPYYGYQQPYGYPYQGRGYRR